MSEPTTTWTVQQWIDNASYWKGEHDRRAEERDLQSAKVDGLERAVADLEKQLAAGT